MPHKRQETCIAANVLRDPYERPDVTASSPFIHSRVAVPACQSAEEQQRGSNGYNAAMPPAQWTRDQSTVWA